MLSLEEVLNNFVDKVEVLTERYVELREEVQGLKTKQLLTGREEDALENEKFQGDLDEKVSEINSVLEELTKEIRECINLTRAL